MACGQGDYPAVVSPQTCKDYDTQSNGGYAIIESCYKTGWTPVCILG